MSPRGTAAAVRELLIDGRDRVAWFPTRRSVPTALRRSLREAIPGWPACTGAMAAADADGQVMLWIAYGPWFGMTGSWTEVHAAAISDVGTGIARTRVLTRAVRLLPSLLDSDGVVIDIDPRRADLMSISRSLGFEEVERRIRHGADWSIRRLSRERCGAVPVTELTSSAHSHDR